MSEPGQGRAITAAQRAMLVQRHLHPAHHDRLSGVFAWWFDRPDAVEPDALRRAAARLVDRHEMLRSGLRITPEPAAHPRPLAGVPFTVRPVAAGAATDLATVVNDLLASEASRPFDIATGPLVRFICLNLGQHGWVVAMMVHHLACDGWSAGVLAEELSQLYRHATAPPGRAEAGPALPAPQQLGDVASRQRAGTSAAERARALDYWTSQLAELTPVELPAARPPPAIPSGRGGTVRAPIPPATMGALHALGIREHVSLFVTGLAAFLALAGRYAGVDDVAVGTPVAGRDDPDTWRAVGMLADTVVIRTSLRSEPAFRELLGAVRDSVLAALDHRGISFDEVVAALNPHRAAGRNPLFQLMFAVDRSIPLQLGDQAERQLLLDRDLSMLDLAVTLLEHQPDEWWVQVQYDTDRFDRTRIARLVDNYLELLAGAAASPELPVSQLPLLAAGERELVLRWGGAPARPDPARTATSLFEQEADRVPGATAVVDGSAEFSYAELDRLANGLAHRLRELGVGPGEVVGIHAGRSHWLVVALLGVWKAGAGYLPLDPSYPAQRLAFMTADAGARVVVTDAEVGFELGSGVATVPLDRAGGWARPERPPPTATGHDLAYLIYTSGSTGRPKAVAVPHRAVVSAFQAWDALYQLPRDGARYPQVASFSFDNSVGEFVRPLCSGGTLYLCSRDEVRDADAFLAYLARTRPYLMDVVPTFVRLAQRAIRYDTVLPALGLRHLAIGGERWTTAEAEALRARLPGCRLLNVYGLTEATVDSTFHVVEPSEPGPWLPIGRPFANTAVYVLDRWGECVPVGVVGELCVAGPALAWGYVNRPRLTAERFVPDPYGPPGGRMYRTGDRCRFRADASLEFLGRSDTQVKVRGFRVELGEAEAALARYPGIRRAVMVLDQRPARPPGLVAYVAADRELEVAAVRDQLRHVLPGYMLPTALVQLPELPLLPNGKVDRSALPDPPAPPEADRAGEPADPLDREVAAIWSAALGTPVTDPDATFFELGGTSLLAIQIVAEVRNRLGRHLPFTAVFDHQTLGEFSRACRTAATAIPEPGPGTAR